MDVEEFCIALHDLSLGKCNEAIAILWFHDRHAPGATLSAGQLARIMRDSGLGHPHSTRLGEAIKRTGLVLSSRRGLQLKPTARQKIAAMVQSILDPAPPAIDHDTAYIPKVIWDNTRGYIETIAQQINGSEKCLFLDGASVLIRRLIETLLIEVYEHLHREDEIKGPDDNYVMLGLIIKKVTEAPGLPLGRDTKSALHDIKVIGDRAAHNRRYTTTLCDLAKINSGVRLAVEELIQLADLKRKT